MNISLKNVVYTPGKKVPEIIKDINCTFEEGYIYGILGPNGAGKTTLVKNMIKLLGVTGGYISYDDLLLEEMSRGKLAKDVSFLPQDTLVQVEFTVYEIIAMGRTPHIKKFSALKDVDIYAINRAMELTNVKYLKDRDVRSLSGGERQRVILARCIAQDTGWIFLDEPVANLDIKHQVELMRLMVEMKEQQGKTVVSVLHDINLALKYCDKIILLKNGEIFKDGFVEEVITEENLKQVFGIEFDFQKNNNGSKFVVPRD